MGTWAHLLYPWVLVFIQSNNMEHAIETILTLTNWMITYQMNLLHPWSDKSQLDFNSFVK